MVNTNRDDLKGIAQWDEHRQCWTPAHGKQAEVATALGPTWVFDEYFGSFFGEDPPLAVIEPTSCYPDCGGYTCSVESDEMEGVFASLAQSAVRRRGDFVMESAEMAPCAPAETAAGVRQVESKALAQQEMEVEGVTARVSEQAARLRLPLRVRIDLHPDGEEMLKRGAQEAVEIEGAELIRALRAGRHKDIVRLADILGEATTRVLFSTSR